MTVWHYVGDEQVRMSVRVSSTRGGDHDMQSTDRGRALEILMVDDNPADVGLTIEALDEEGVRHHVSVVEDGREALAFLRRDGAFAKSPRPDLILLDLNMPRMKGHEFLEEMRSDPNLQEIPVVVFSHSDAPVDRARSDALAALHVKKPLDLAEFMEVVAEIVDLPQIRWAKRPR